MIVTFRISKSMVLKQFVYPLSYPDYSVNWQLVREAISPKTKAIIINSPHNPTGYVWTKEDMLMLDEITRDTHIYIISDEVYEHLTFDEKPHESVLKYPSLFCAKLGNLFIRKSVSCNRLENGLLYSTNRNHERVPPRNSSVFEFLL